jgi:hypothetical protein
LRAAALVALCGRTRGRRREDVEKKEERRMRKGFRRRMRTGFREDEDRI